MVTVNILGVVRALRVPTSIEVQVHLVLPYADAPQPAVLLKSPAAAAAAARMLDVHVSTATASRTISHLEEVIEQPVPALHELMHIKWCIGVFCVSLHARAKLCVL